jgi:hypothetical protein
MARIHLIDGGDQVSCRRGTILFQRGPTMHSAIGLPPARTVVLLFTFALLSGCSAAGAPSFDLFGAFFPAWLFCAVLGVASAGAARGVFVASGLAERLPYQLFVCTAIGLMAACLAWLIGFGW